MCVCDRQTAVCGVNEKKKKKLQCPSRRNPRNSKSSDFSILKNISHKLTQPTEQADWCQIDKTFWLADPPPPPPPHCRACRERNLENKLCNFAKFWAFGAEILKRFELWIQFLLNVFFPSVAKKNPHIGTVGSKSEPCIKSCEEQMVVATKKPNKQINNFITTNNYIKGKQITSW